MRGPGMGPPGFGGMGMPVQKAKNFRQTLVRLIAYLKPHRFKLVFVVLAAALSTLFSIYSPDVTGKAVTELSKGLIGAKIDFDVVNIILIKLAALYVISSLFSYLQQYMMAGVAQRTVYDLRKQVNEKFARLPLKFYDSRTNGEILSRVVNDVDNISTTLQQSLTQFITSFITLVGVIIMMLTISPLMTLIVFLTIPVSLVAAGVIAKKSQVQFVRQQAELGKLNGHVEEMYTGHKIVKAFGHERKSLEQFNEMNEKLYESGWRAQFVSGIIMPIMTLIGNIGYVFVSIVGGVLVTKRAIELGDILAFITYTRQFTMPITQLATISNVIQSTIASAERVFELLDEEEEEPEASDAKTIAAPKGNVRFERVKFGYSPEKALIDNMNIDVKSGQTVAIVGPTGAGKTTLINLLMRFYELQDGQIAIDGVPITAMQRSGLRRMFGMVLQDTWLFNGTIRDNIGYGREGASEEEIVEAAKAAHADHFIRTLPDGYDTILNEEASNISQGQKQLLTIARAILADPSILILDEATSSVDTRTEVYIQKAMNDLMQGRTSFVIAHRLSTIRDADLILVMDKGTIIEQGTHTELLSRHGFYADLYNSQFTGKSIQADTNAV
ncbi:ABC transporter ATP-binding protein [Paenibacillus sp. NEAU-GSW1]|uniref:ABC transporter ATP-binding protein n=1 Tax=Paenibacillus sp. NEAU-GSW1 TaxID=2682486 RepID=UPI0012E20FB7|nr:ABC transporter ATP-binding protein [Paenibacillus sp. NEAU-GSW1]MUT66906.1 ATP-binding cassette domain-containing protein [Paenibacillus sp. NEAU-GSW1]